MTEDPIRVVRLYGLPPVRSQSVYHAVAYEATPAGPPRQITCASVSRTRLNPSIS